MFCNNCGASLPSGSVICKNCNTPLKFDQIARNNEMNSKVINNKRKKDLSFIKPIAIIFFVLIALIILAIFI